MTLRKGSLTANQISVGTILLAVVLLGALVVQSYLHLRGILAAPSTRRGEFVSALGPPLMSLTSALLVRRDSKRRWRSALALAFLAGLIAYSLAALGVFAFGQYGPSWASLGPLLVGAWFALSGLIELAPAIVYVRYADQPQPAVAIALTAAVFLSQVAMLVAPVVALLLFWQRGWVRSLSAGTAS